MALFACRAESPPRSGAPEEPAADARSAPADARPAPADAAARAASLPLISDSGPVLAVRPAWSRCAKAADCIEVYSGCGTRSVIVNRRSEKEVRAAWKKTCGERPPMGVLAARVELTCEERRCRAAGGFDGALNHGFGKLASASSGLSPRRAEAGGEPPPRVRQRRPEVEGALAPEVANRFLRRLRPRLTACLERHGNAAEASATVRLSIDARGRVAGASVSGVVRRPLARCIERAYRAASFPSGGELTVRQRVELGVFAAAR